MASAYHISFTWYILCNHPGLPADWCRPADPRTGSGPPGAQARGARGDGAGGTLVQEESALRHGHVRCRGGSRPRSSYTGSQMYVHITLCYVCKTLPNFLIITFLQRALYFYTEKIFLGWVSLVVFGFIIDYMRYYHVTLEDKKNEH